MKLAVTSSGPRLENRMEARFGRCPYFLLIDPETLAFETVENPNIALSGGAGIQSAQLMAEKGVTVVLTGNCGPNAFQVFGAAGIQVITGVDGTVLEAVEQYNSGRLKDALAPSVEAHFGMGEGGQTADGAMAPSSGMPAGTGGDQMGGPTGMGRGMGMGRGGKGCGMGRGMGMGGGKGRGRGMMGGGSAMAASMPAPGSPAIRTGGSREEEMKLLKRSAEDLRRQLESIESRIDDITKSL